MPGVKGTNLVLVGEAPDSLESGFFCAREDLGAAK
jgi:hypothetical protein